MQTESYDEISVCVLSHIPEYFCNICTVRTEFYKFFSTRQVLFKTFAHDIREKVFVRELLRNIISYYLLLQ